MGELISNFDRGDAINLFAVAFTVRLLWYLKKRGVFTRKKAGDGGG